MNIETNFESRMHELTERIKYRLILGGNAVKIVKRQFGLLMRLLIDLSFPKDRQKSAKRIDKSVSSRFKEMPDISGDPAKAGHKDVTWTGSSRFALYGVDKSGDYRSASAEELQGIYWQYQQGQGRGTNANREKVSRGHGKQDIYIWRVATRKAAVNALKRLMTGNLGKLKAAWLKGLEKCGSPGRDVPGWITRHAGSVDSDATIDVGNSTPDKIGDMVLTAVNRQAGAGKLKESGLLESAAHQRGELLAGDIKFSIEHPDKWHEREAQYDEELVS